MNWPPRRAEAVKLTRQRSDAALEFPLAERARASYRVAALPCACARRCRWRSEPIQLLPPIHDDERNRARMTGVRRRPALESMRLGCYLNSFFARGARAPFFAFVPPRVADDDDWPLCRLTGALLCSRALWQRSLFACFERRAHSLSGAVCLRRGGAHLQSRSEQP